MSDVVSSTEDIAVTKFREYLRVNTEQPNPDYHACKEFLFALADSIGIRAESYECVPGKPIIIMTIEGSQPHLPSIMLSSHTDVVPTYKESWTYDPYAAHKDEDGNIYGRGAQDMKCVGSQYFEAIRRHFLHGKRHWKRTIHIVWGPDEEIGGTDGMCAFTLTDYFKSMNVGFVLDEAYASRDDVYRIVYGERVSWHVQFICEGSPGHSAGIYPNTAAHKLQSLLNNVMAYRDEQVALLKSGVSLGETVTVNMTMINGGVQANVIPSKYEAVIDMRIPPTTPHKTIEDLLDKWVKEAGAGVTYTFQKKDTMNAMTAHTAEDKWWKALTGALDKLGCKYKNEIMPGGTDARYSREKGIAAFGFSPMINTPILLHAHNEYLNEKVFLRGVEIYEHVINAVASV